MNLLEVTTGTWTITLVGWGLVFVALIVLVLVFNFIPKIHNYFRVIKLHKQGKVVKNEHINLGKITGEESAAIAMALHMYFNEQHDEENGVMTIKRIERRYSPWNSKIYSLNNRNF